MLRALAVLATVASGVRVHGPQEVRTVVFSLLSEDTAQADAMELVGTPNLWVGNWTVTPPPEIWSAVQSSTFVNGFEAALDETAGDTKLNGTVAYRSKTHKIQLKFDCEQGAEGSRCAIGADAFTRDRLKDFTTFVGSTLVYTAVFGAPASSP